LRVTGSFSGGTAPFIRTRLTSWQHTPPFCPHRVHLLKLQVHFFVAAFIYWGNAFIYWYTAGIYSFHTDIFSVAASVFARTMPVHQGEWSNRVPVIPLCTGQAGEEACFLLY
jgi:hypothetical protein